MLVMLALAARADAYVYWTDAEADVIGRANLDGTGVNRSFIPGVIGNPAHGFGIQGVAVDDQYIYWTNWGHGTIGRANLYGDPNSINQSFVASPGGSPGGIAVDDKYVYWTTGRAIGRASVADGSGVNPSFITGMSDVNTVAVDDKYIYWTNALDNTIGRATLPDPDDSNGVPTSANPSFITGASFPEGMAVTATKLYWNNGGHGVWTIGSANLPDAPDGLPTNINQSFIAGLAGTQGVAVHGVYVFRTTAPGPSANPTAVGSAKVDGHGVRPNFIAAGPDTNLPFGVAADALPATCDGAAATIAGTGQADRLLGTNGDDVMAAQGGDDTVTGLGGDDVVCGSGGADVIRGSGGDDTLRGGGGKDELRGGGGSNRCRGGSGADSKHQCCSDRRGESGAVGSFSQGPAVSRRTALRNNASARY